jgi:hypothetical protein
MLFSALKAGSLHEVEERMRLIFHAIFFICWCYSWNPPLFLFEYRSSCCSLKALSCHSFSPPQPLPLTVVVLKTSVKLFLLIAVQPNVGKLIRLVNACRVMVCVGPPWVGSCPWYAETPCFSDPVWLSLMRLGMLTGLVLGYMHVTINHEAIQIRNWPPIPSEPRIGIYS